MTNGELKSVSNARLLKSIALGLGFDSCRISKAGFLEHEAPRLEAWLRAGRHGKMGYMANHFDKRLNPQLLVDDAKSLVTLTFNYLPKQEMDAEGNFKISKYAYGEDYHTVLKTRLETLMTDFRAQAGQVHGRVFVDSAPVLEKAWAVRNGTGWQGKHTNLVHPRRGSFFFLCELIIDMELDPDPPMADHCGTCTRCIDACPTEAIVAPYQLDATRCISYLTIELKEAIPNSFQGKMDNWIFGCDVCQDVCPWNKKFSVATTEPAFAPSPALAQFTKTDWLEITSEVFRQVFPKSAIKRTKFEGLKRNIVFAAGSMPQAQPQNNE